MRSTLGLINQMQESGVIGKYAIGGAVGATFYLEPSATMDLDVFVLLPSSSDGLLLSLAPLYEFLTARGCKAEGAHIVIGDWPVQFLPVSNALEQEAVDEAVETSVEGVKTRVMAAEHLIAIALRTGRAKDYARIIQFLELDTLNNDRLNDILARHGLTTKWQQFKRKYLEQDA